MKILFLNGPPGSGKDYAGRLISALIPHAHVTKFAKVLKERTHGLYGVSSGPGGGPAPHDWFESRKDEPASEFFGLTPREAYIGVSETYMKPTHGEDIFGKLLLQELTSPKVQGSPIAVITDSGFVEEAATLVHHFTPEQCFMLHIKRRGCTFDGDSRGFVDLRDLAVPTTDIWNTGNSDFMEDIILTLGHWLPLRYERQRLPRYL